LKIADNACALGMEVGYKLLKNKYLNIVADVKRQQKLLTGHCGSCPEKTLSFYNDKRMPQKD
jgi:hypothetical protein